MCNQCKIFTEKGKYYCPESMDFFKYCPFCGEELKFEEDKTEESLSICDYLRSLDDGTREGINYEKWRYGIDYYIKHPDISIDDFVNHIEKKFNKMK